VKREKEQITDTQLIYIGPQDKTLSGEEGSSLPRIYSSIFNGHILTAVVTETFVEEACIIWHLV